MDKGTLRRADLVTSIILMAFSSFVIAESVKYLQKTLSKGRPWFESSGLFPLIISILLLLCAILLLFRALKDGARFDFLTKEKVITFLHTREFSSNEAVSISFSKQSFLQFLFVSFEHTSACCQKS